jgi:glutamate-1-semialdehyde 2,1-aminomutase
VGSQPLSESSAVAELHRRAGAVLPGGVTSGSRHHAALGRPFYVQRGSGCHLTDLDGIEFIDFTGGSGASLLGHAHPAVDEAVASALHDGTICTAETEDHVALAERLCGLIPSAEMVRFANSGTEATQIALRVARAATGRDRILRFAGHYHGMHDAVLTGWTNSADDTGHAPPDSLGVAPAMTELTHVAPFNDTDALLRTLDAHGDEIAAVILEPVSYNMGCVPADPQWLQVLRDQTRRRGIVLIFDEVLSGFRMGIAGAQGHYGITPDLTTLGKALGAGWPIAAIGGRADIMSVLAPGGGVPLSGTYTTHLAAVRAANTALKIMAAPGFYENLNRRSATFCAELERLFDTAGIIVRVQSLGARFGMYFGMQEPVTDFTSACRSDIEASRAFVTAAFREGLYFADFPGRKVPMHYGIGAAHTDRDLTEALESLARAVARLEHTGAMPALR